MWDVSVCIPIRPINPRHIKFKFINVHKWEKYTTKSYKEFGWALRGLGKAQWSSITNMDGQLCIMANRNRPIKHRAHRQKDKMTIKVISSFHLNAHAGGITYTRTGKLATRHNYHRFQPKQRPPRVFIFYLRILTYILFRNSKWPAMPCSIFIRYIFSPDFVAHTDFCCCYFF